MYWKLAGVTNGIVAIAYLMLAFAIVRGLVTSRQLRTNRLGLATAAIFFTCGAGHACYLVYMLLPSFGVGFREGVAMRAAYDWPLVSVDLITSGVALWYWSLRSAYRVVPEGPTLFDDVKARQRQALEINDNVVQGLTVARYALGSGDRETALTAIDATLSSARQIISDLVGEQGSVTRLGPGDLVRAAPATVPDRGR